MIVDADRISVCRELALRILSGEMTPESHPMQFDDDVVFFAVRALEEQDAEWLLSHIRDRQYPVEGRRNLASCMGRYQADIWSELRAEDPALPPLFPE